MKTAQIESIIGALSSPSKMPCYSYSIPARHCITGQKLRNVEGSICSKCYALKGHYVFPNVQSALDKRFEGIRHPQWVDLLSQLIHTKETSGFFRWHDSGDLQSVQHLANICEIARRLPGISFWLPTREFSIVAEYLTENSLPTNLTIRLSALMFDGAPPTAIAQRLGLVTSGASSSATATCPSAKQGGKCLECRACWDKRVANVNYKQH